VPGPVPPTVPLEPGLGHFETIKGTADTGGGGLASRSGGARATALNPCGRPKKTRKKM